jgi:translocation and assembly module TamB
VAELALDRDDAPAELIVVHRRRVTPLAVLKWLAILMLGLMALAAVLVAALNTTPGRRFVADRVAALEFESGMRIRVGRIDGSLYGQMVLNGLTVSDPRGVFLSSPEVRVDWRPFAYLKNHVDLRSATARSMTLRRLPQFNAAPPSDGPLLPDLDIDIGRLAVERFIIEPPVSGERRIAASGSLPCATSRASSTRRCSRSRNSARAGWRRTRSPRI